MGRALGWALALACLAGGSAGADRPPPAGADPAGYATTAGIAGGSGDLGGPGDVGRPGDAATVGDAGWSDTRMRRAVPPDALPAATRLAAPTPVRTAARWTAGGGTARAVGRVFYTLRGRDYTCTGVAVRSANRSTVLTAGHCVHAGPGAYATNWVFVPGYAAGRRPYGTWVASRLAAPPEWVRSGRTADDVGYAVVAPLGGRRLTDVVGGAPIAFDAPPGAYVWAVGYPAAAPNDGRRALYCRGAVRPDPYRTEAQGLACSMGQGASGGPWLLAGGAVYAVTSFTYRGLGGLMWAPPLGASARAVYRSVQHAPARPESVRPR